MIDGKEYLMENEEAEYIKSLIKSGQFKFMPLSNGDIININSVARIGELDKKKFWGGNPLDKDGNYFWREGDQIHLGAKEQNEIELLDDPKYLKMQKIKLLK